MEQKQVSIKEMSLVELKALAFDIAQERDLAIQNLNIIYKEMEERIKAEKKVEPLVEEQKPTPTRSKK